MNYDLTVLLPEEDTLTLDDLSGDKHVIKIRIPSVVGAFIFQNQEKFSQLVSGAGTDEEGMKFITRLLSLILSAQHPFMTEEWVIANISFDRQLFIVRLFGNHLIRAVNSLGQGEAAQPVKEPEESA